MKDFLLVLLACFWAWWWVKWIIVLIQVIPDEIASYKWRQRQKKRKVFTGPGLYKQLTGEHKEKFRSFTEDFKMLGDSRLRPIGSDLDEWEHRFIDEMNKEIAVEDAVNCLDEAEVIEEIKNNQPKINNHDI